MKNKKQPAEIKNLAKQAKQKKFDPEFAEVVEGEVDEVKRMPVGESVSISELRVKLHAKIAMLRGGRGGNLNTTAKVLEKRKKAPVKIVHPKKRQQETAPVEAVEKAVKKVKTVVEDVSFGTISFGGEKKKQGLDTMSKLKKVESSQAKLEKIKQVNPEKANLIVEAQKWDKLMNLAVGVKVMDDPKLLKKTLKKQEKKKEKSGKVWVDRKETVRKHEEDGQKRRNENLLARKEGRPTKRTSSKRPGFEGAGKKSKK